MAIHFNDYPWQYADLIKQQMSFEIQHVPLSEMLTVCAELEEHIESLGMKCRVYTEKRSVSLLSAAYRWQWGLISGAIIAAHQFLTYNPDYEISRDLANNRISVKYKH